MKVVVKEVGKKAEVREIANELADLQKIVGGYIEVVRVDADVLMICDEEGKLKGKPYNFDLGRDIIVGDVLFVQSYSEDFTDLNEANVEKLLKYFDRTPYQS